MANIVKDKLDKIFNNPVSKIFKDKGYRQDSEERKAQMSFYKLLMILAYCDDEIDENEIDMIKDHFYEDCLTEDEWKELDFYRFNKPNKNEIQDILENVLLQIQKSKDKTYFINALKDIINADDVLKDQEKEILAFLSDKINSSKINGFKSIFQKIKNNVKSKNSFSKIDVKAVEFSNNPVSPILKAMFDKNFPENIEKISAKLGLALIVIHSDSHFDDKEKQIFKEMLMNECNIDNERLNTILAKILEIPEEYFELTRLSRIIIDSTDEEERIAFLKELFKIARANQVYDIYEDKYLKLIAKSIFISDKNFIKVKCNEI